MDQMDLKRRDEEENKERQKDKKVIKSREENDIPKVRWRVIGLGRISGSARLRQAVPD